MLYGLRSLLSCGALIVGAAIIAAGAAAAPIAGGGVSSGLLTLTSVTGGSPIIDFIIGPPGPPAVSIFKDSSGDGDPDAAPLLTPPPPGATSGSSILVGAPGPGGAIDQFALALAQVTSAGFAASDVLTTGAIEISNSASATSDVVATFLFEWSVAVAASSVSPNEETRGTAGVFLKDLKDVTIPVPGGSSLSAIGVAGGDTFLSDFGSTVFALTIAPGDANGVITLVDANAFAAIPAPATMILMGLGLAGLLLQRRRP